MILAATTPSPMWFVSRGLGAAALTLLTASLALGIISGAGVRSVGWPRFASAGLHRNLSLFTLVLLAVHIATAVLDPFARIRWQDAVVPFGSAYRPVWVGAGAIAVDVLLAISLTTAIRRHIGYRVWRVIHWSGYSCWPAAILHGLGTGTDVRAPWMAALYMMCLVSVTGLVAWRVAVSRLHPGTRAALQPAVLVSALLILVFSAAGPLRPGWARASGTPADILGGVVKPTPSPPSPELLVDSATGGHRLRVTVVAAPGSGQTLLITDLADPTVQFVVRPPRMGETGPVLAVLHNGQLGCVAAAAVSETITARCASTEVRMRLDGPVPIRGGWLWVGAQVAASP